MRSTAYGQGTIGGKPAGTHWPLAGEGAPLAAKRTVSLRSETLWMAMSLVMPYRSRSLTKFTGGGLDGRQLALACGKAFQRWRRHVLGGPLVWGIVTKGKAPVACPVYREEEEGAVRPGTDFNVEDGPLRRTALSGIPFKESNYSVLKGGDPATLYRSI